MPGRFSSGGIRTPACILTVLLLLCGGPCLAAEAKIHFDVPAAKLREMLKEVSPRSGFAVIYFDSTIGEIELPALLGDFTGQQAVEHLLAGQPVQLVRVD